MAGTFYKLQHMSSTAANKQNCLQLVGEMISQYAGYGLNATGCAGSPERLTGTSCTLQKTTSTSDILTKASPAP